jgi:hypothetical protein
MTTPRSFEIELGVTLPNEEDVDVLFTGVINPYFPAFIAGPPEDCYPEEGGDIEDLQVQESDEGNPEDYDSWAARHGFDDKAKAAMVERLQEVLTEREADRAVAYYEDRDSRYW